MSVKLNIHPRGFLLAHPNQSIIRSDHKETIVGAAAQQAKYSSPEVLFVAS